MLVISKEPQNEHGLRYTYSSAVWTSNPLVEDCVIVPLEMEEAILATQGYCDIELNEEGTEVVAFYPIEIPQPMSEEDNVYTYVPTEAERLLAVEKALLQVSEATADVIEFFAYQVTLNRIALEEIPEQYRESVKSKLDSQYKEE